MKKRKKEETLKAESSFLVIQYRKEVNDSAWQLRRVGL